MREQMSVLYTVGFSGKDAKTFFELLKLNNVQTLLDIRLNNVSQLSGYTKKNDLAYFLDKICDIKYKHLPILAPTKEILDAYKAKKISWNDYEAKYIHLINERKIENELKNIDFNRACLLCSEKSAEQCHRRLAANTIRDMFMVEKVIHL
jgi:uncharacterized protein (DUF488 family)